MKQLWKEMKGLVVQEDGATAVEYAVMLALIIAVAIITIVILGNKVENAFNRVQQKLVNS